MTEETPLDEDLDLPEGWEEEDWDTPARRPTTARHPVILLLVLAGAGFLLVENWPQAAIMFAETGECGNISDRPILRAEGRLTPLEHDTFCHLTGAVQNNKLLGVGLNDDGSDDGKPDVEPKYFLKLDGDRVFAVIAVRRKDVQNHKTRKWSLLGFEIDDVGRIIDPDREPRLAGTARQLRNKYALADTESIRLFDTTQRPRDQWPYVLVCALMIFTMLLALFALVRVVLARRER